MKGKKYIAQWLPRGGDIETGDRVFNSSGWMYQTGTELHTQEGDVKAGLYLCIRGEHPEYTRMGLISPKAKWVNQGDEFSEEEVTIVVEGIEEVYEVAYLVKCPLCGVFQ